MPRSSRVCCFRAQARMTSHGMRDGLASAPEHATLHASSPGTHLLHPYLSTGLLGVYGGTHQGAFAAMQHNECP